MTNDNEVVHQLKAIRVLLDCPLFYLGDRVKAIGIIPDADSAAYQLFSDGKVNFDLYLPGNKEQFANDMHLIFKLAQTIVVYRNKVKAVKMGNLAPADVEDLLKTIRSIIERKKGE
ncbi:MAG: hypothetical protein GY940_37980 [bacterium]|nr:hypothetical protein [bacterium]